MLRTVGSIAAGLLIFVAVAFLGGLAAHALWPDYAAAEADRAYTLPMLLARLATGAAATVIAGWCALRIAQGHQFAALGLGLALLAISVPWHIQIWNEYPVWYHLVWLGCLIPCALLGSRLTVLTTRA